MMRISLVVPRGSTPLRASNPGEFEFYCWTAHRHPVQKIISTERLQIARIERSRLVDISMN